MAKQLFANNAKGRLNAGITDVATTLTLQAGQGALFPNPSAGDWFLSTLVDLSGNIEIIKVTARSGDTFSTIERSQEGTANIAFLASDICELRTTKGTLEALQLTFSTQALSWIASGTTAWDLNLGRSATLIAATGNTTMGAPTNLLAGGEYVLKFTQDSTPRTITWNAVFKWDAGAPPVLSTDSGAIDIISFWSDGTNLYGGQFVRGAA
jgi:hypothetical protein